MYKNFHKYFRFNLHNIAYFLIFCLVLGVKRVTCLSWSSGNTLDYWAGGRGFKPRSSQTENLHK